jgi:hypothetical protein
MTATTTSDGVMEQEQEIKVARAANQNGSYRPIVPQAFHN